MNQHTLTSAPGSAVSPSLPVLADCGLSHSASQTCAAKISCPERGRVSHAGQTCGPSPENNMPGHIYSQPEFLASPRAVPGSTAARQMTAGSGRRLYESFPKSGPLGRCSRILLESETWASPEFFLRWQGNGTKCGCSVFQLAPSVPRTYGNGTGLFAGRSTWPTCTKRDDKGQTQNRQRMDYVPNIVKATWGTPNCMDAMGPRTPEALAKAKAGCANIKDQIGPATSGCLAQTESFVVRLTTLSAWLMGYTGAYLRHWETRLSGKSRRKS